MAAVPHGCLSFGVIHLWVTPDSSCAAGTLDATANTISHIRVDCSVYVFLFNTGRVLTVAHQDAHCTDTCAYRKVGDHNG